MMKGPDRSRNDCSASQSRQSPSGAFFASLDCALSRRQIAEETTTGVDDSRTREGEAQQPIEINERRSVFYVTNESIGAIRSDTLVRRDYCGTLFSHQMK
ncbi:MAG: hypothetical protein AMXMBFR47_26120 [Planctomycetota bacterium]